MNSDLTSILAEAATMGIGMLIVKSQGPTSDLGMVDVAWIFVYAALRLLLMVAMWTVERLLINQVEVTESDFHFDPVEVVGVEFTNE